MKSILTIATLALASALVGCNDANKKDAAPGAVSGNCCGCSGDTMPVAPGAVSADSCASSCSDAAPGAVSSDAGCASSCSDAAPGAVSSEASSCGSASEGPAMCPFSGSAG